MAVETQDARRFRERADDMLIAEAARAYVKAGSASWGQGQAVLDALMHLVIMVEKADAREAEIRRIEAIDEAGPE